MSDTSLKELFSCLQKDMCAKADFSSVLDHPTDKGDNTEVNWIDWFNEYLPKRYKAAKATIIDSQGGISDQIDVAIYDEQYSYLAFNHKGILYLPAESVYAVFEVKQKINKKYMEYAGKKAESVRSLIRTSAPIKHAGGTYNPKKPHRILAGILTTGSDWKDAYGDSFRACLNSYTEFQQIDCGCVLRAGSFSYDYSTKEISLSLEEESLVFFFLNLLIELQKMGTVPAIDLHAYMSALTIKTN